MAWFHETKPQFLTENMNKNTHSLGDYIKLKGDIVRHVSSGGFLFYERNKDNELFVALIKDQYGVYTIPKGHRKDPEKLIDTARREINEELSISLDLVLVSKIAKKEYDFDNNGQKHHKTVHIYLFETNKKISLHPGKYEGISEARWIRLDNAKKMICSKYKNLLFDCEVAFYRNKSKKKNKMSKKARVDNCSA